MINTVSSIRSVAATPKKDITIGQLAKGLAGTVPGAVIDSVGLTGTAILHTPRAVVDAYRGLYWDAEHGPVTKTLMGALIPVAVGVAIPLVALGSFGYGVVTGAMDAANTGLKESVDNRFKDVKNANKFLHEGLDGLEKEIEREKSQQQPIPPAPPAPPAKP